MSSVTVDELLRERALVDPARLAYIFLDSDGEEQASITYGELDRRARSIAAVLQSFGTAGSRAVLLYPPGLDYIAAFFGCLYSKTLAVPAYPPRRNQSGQRLQGIVANAEPAFVLTTGAIRERSGSLFEQAPEVQPMRWLATDNVLAAYSDLWRAPVARDPDEPAFLQYTSGSTSRPRGVIVSHRNLLHNQALIRAAFHQTENSIIVGWLPLYHDMGLIGNVLQSLYLGARCILMSPQTFLQRPGIWLETITRYGATTSGGPNFAYDLCVRKVSAEQRAILDLSTWEVAFNGAEPVRALTLERFTETFAECGFRRQSFHPCYGLAEATLLVTAGRSDVTRSSRSFASDSLHTQQASETSLGEHGVTELVACGVPDPSQHTVVIVESEKRKLCPSGSIGEIWVAGPSVAGGYWNCVEESERTFAARLADTDEGPFLRTGDLGFINRGELFITGRLKDLIIIRGTNHYPGDIEATVEACGEPLRPNCGAAFGVEVEGAEQLVVVHEVDARRTRDASNTLSAIRQAVALQHEVQPYAVALLRAGSIPKTSSGKIQRHKCRAKFIAGELDVIAEWRETQPGAAAQSNPKPAGGGATEIEVWLIAKLASKIGVPVADINAHQAVARYGLDSLAAIELVHEVEAELGVSLPVMSFLTDASIAQLAAELETKLKDSHAEEQPITAHRIAAEGGQEPLSYGQRTVWFFQRLAPDSPAYNVALPLRVTGKLDAATLRRAFAMLVERHSSLRTTFSEVDGEPIQVVHSSLDFLFHREDATGWDDAKLSAYLSEELDRPFDLGSGPLLRIHLLRRAAERHVLLLMAHHIVVDFWSLAILMRELSELYQAERAVERVQLAPLSRCYADFVSWQREMLGGSRGEQLRAYWDSEIAGELTTLNLPADRAHYAEQTGRGATQLAIIDDELTSAIEALGREQGTTLYMTLLAAFQVLLHRYTGQKSFFVGSPTSGRSRAEWAPLIGYFVNPVALRADFTADVTFAEHLQRVRRTVVGALEHQDYPLAALMSGSQMERDASRPELFQVMFVLQKAHFLRQEGLAALMLAGETGTRVALADLELEVLPLPWQTTQFDLTLMAVRIGGGIAIALQYKADLFAPERISRMLEHYRALLAGLVANPGRRVSRVSILTEGERAQQIDEWNKTRSDYPTTACVHQLFEEQAARSPNALAVAHRHEQLTYDELNGRANQLAHRLCAFGVGPEVPVCVLIDRSPEMIVAMLAVLKAGGAYVPLDPNYPHERIAYMVADSGASVLLTCHRNSVTAPPLDGVRVLDLDDDALDEERDDNLATRVLPDNLAYIIYTSGSSGKPKGVCVRHSSVVNLLTWHQHAYGVTAGDRATQLASPAFDASVWELWPYLTAGASLHIPDDATRASAPELCKWLASEAVTICFLPTPLAEALLAEDLSITQFALRALLTGGDKLRHAPLQPLPFTLVNHYGPTECTVVATRATVVVDPLRSDTPPPIGRAIANTETYVLDCHLHPVPVGVPAELYLGGVGVARGYLNAPALTAERFLPDPFAATPGSRIYRTGDLARWLSDGRLEFVGRIDSQVKLRGLRIELGEIEAALNQHKDVRECVVVSQGTDEPRKRLVAYILASDHGTPAAGKLRVFLKDKLPEYMIPQAFVLLPEWPITLNGKVDRAALLELDSVLVEQEETSVAPRTAVEELLVGIWSQILGIAEIGVTENFFTLGGHSLLATRVISRVRECLQVELPLRSLFESPTVAELAAQIETALQAGQQPQMPPLVPVLRDRALPMSSAQQRLWFLDRLEPDSTAYNLPAAMVLRGQLNLAALGQSLTEIVRRHEVLRTTIAVQDGQPVQVIAPATPREMPLTDLRPLAAEAREREVAQVISDEARTPFDLTSGPLMRSRVLRLDEDEHVLLINIHHIIADGWSAGILSRELSALYEAYSEGRASPLPELTIQYADFAHWQQQMLAGDQLEGELAYWREHLSPPPVILELPSDRPRPAVQTYNGASESVTLPVHLQTALKQLSISKDVTLYMTLLAAFKVLLHRYTGETDVTVGTPIAGRTEIETEHLIGFFANTLVLRTDLSGNPTFLDLLHRVREVALGAYLHQHVPFEKLVEELHTARDLSHTPLFQVMLALQNAPAQMLELASLSVSPVHVPATTAKFDLLMYCEESETGLKFTLEYNTDLFDGTTIQRLLQHWQNILAGVVADPNARISVLPLMDEAERRLLLCAWNDTAQEYSGPALIHEFFERSAERTPDAIAVHSAQGILTYRQLNKKANRLARDLRKHGVGPEVLVGVLLERTPELVLALLAVLKAGGAYVPLDVAYPGQRMAFIIEDTQTPLLLTHNSLRDRIPQQAARVLMLDRDCKITAQGESGNLPTSAQPHNLAYVIYTSGSTGRPKGVAITHHSATTFLNWALATFTAEQLSGVLASTSICFDLSVYELFAPLACSGKVNLIENALQLSALDSDAGVTLINTVPSAITELLRLRAIPPSVLTVNLAGEPLSQKLADQIFAQTESVEEVWNLYGPSEDTTYSTAARLRRGKGEAVTIGKPIACTRAYLLDDAMQPVVVGVPGELYLAGDGLARGYLNAPGLTAERFLPDPFAATPGCRIYRTGDLGRWLADGQLEFLGRIDNQVKLRGFRIELGEIEAALTEHKDVRETVVVARTDDGASPLLVAYVVAHDGAPPLADALRRHLRERLPEYMVPSSFVMLPALPLTPNRKVDRQALPAPDETRRDVSGAFVAARNATEEALAHTWREVLHLKQVGIHDNFFELGGHSLLASQVIAKLTETFGVELPLRTIFESPTVAGLSAAIETARSARVEAPTAPILPFSREAFRISVSSRREFDLPEILKKSSN